MPYNKNVDEAMIEITLSSPVPVSNEVELPQNETPVSTQKEEKKTKGMVVGLRQ